MNVTTNGVWKWLAGLLGAALITGVGAFLVLGADTPSRTEMHVGDKAVETIVKEWVNTHRESNKTTLTELKKGLQEVKKDQTAMQLNQAKFQSEVHTKLDLLLEKRKNN